MAVAFVGWIRGEDGRLRAIDQAEGWTSPRLGVRFEKEDGELRIIRPDGSRFLTYLEVEQERLRAQQQAEQERQRAERLEQRLREMGIDPEQI